MAPGKPVAAPEQAEVPAECFGREKVAAKAVVGVVGRGVPEAVGDAEPEVAVGCVVVVSVLMAVLVELVVEPEKPTSPTRKRSHISDTGLGRDP